VQAAANVVATMTINAITDRRMTVGSFQGSPVSVPAGVH